MSSEINKLTSHDLAVLESLCDAKSAISQREIAKRTGLSLGLINAVIKRLVTTGYIKTSHLNRRSIDYLLTPDGFAQTAVRSYRYVLDTVRSYRDIQIKLENLLDDLDSRGVTKYYLHGDGELAELVAIVFARESRPGLQRGLPYGGDSQSVVLNASSEALSSDRYKVVNLVRELGNHGAHVAAMKGGVQG